MKINDINIDNNILTITLDNEYAVTEVYLDNILNRQYFSSKKPREHGFVIEFKPEDDNTTPESRSVITVDITDYNTQTFVVTVYTEDDMARDIIVDEKELYYYKVNLLTKHCDTCLDDKQMDKVMMCCFESHLLEYALEHKLIDDAIDYLYSLNKLLDISDNMECCKHSRCKNCFRHNCVNGICKLW